MADETTTTEEVVDTGAETASPETTAQPEVAANETTTELSEEPADAAVEQPQGQSDIDDKLRTYATSQGLELDSPSAIKAARIAMKAQSEATRNSLKASELEKNLTTTSDEVAEQVAEETGQDPELLKRLQRVEVKEAVRDFWNQDGIDRSFEPKMIELLKTKPHLAGDLDALYATAVMQSGGVATVKSQGKREALESLAQKQQAAVPTGSATTRATPKQKEFKDLSIKEMEKQLGFVRR